ncbi:right-handed parallel beta-helix repeat-containing protein [Mycobacterium sp. C3-094]
MNFRRPLAAVLVVLAWAVAVPVQAQPTAGYDSGLSAPFRMPDASTGTTRNALAFKATPDRAADDDGIAIQRAIRASKPGDVVYLPNGTYHVRSTISLQSGVSLIGESRDKTIVAGAYRSVANSIIYAAPGVGNLTVSSFRLTSSGGAGFEAGIRLGREHGGAVSRIVVRDLMIDRHLRFGVQMQNASHVLVADNVIRNAAAVDGGGSGYGILVDQPLSKNNWIRGNVIGPVIRHGVLVQESANHNLIESNRITGAVSGAIDMHGEDEYSNEIRFNTVSDCVRNGTSVSANGGGIEVGEFSGIVGNVFAHDNSGPRNWIHHNEVYNCTYGLRVVNNSNLTYVEDNNFHHNVVSGILADLAPLQDLAIRRNLITSNGNGVVLDNVKRAVVENNTITSNQRYGLATNGGVTDYVIVDNLVSGSLVDVTLGSLAGTYRPAASS